MGRAYSVRKSAIEKTGAKKGKLYTRYAKEIYKIGRKHGEDSLELTNIIEKAKKEEVPSEIINRAVLKVKGKIHVETKEVIYEAFGPSLSTLVIVCDTDNVNRTVGMVRSVLNKKDRSLGVNNSVLYNYDYLGVLSFLYKSEEEILNKLIENSIDLIDIEKIEEEIIITFNPSDMDKVKNVLNNMNIENFTYDKIGFFAKTEIELEKEELDEFNTIINNLEDLEDVSEVFHNVNI